MFCLRSHFDSLLLFLDCVSQTMISTLYFSLKSGDKSFLTFDHYAVVRVPWGQRLRTPLFCHYLSALLSMLHTICVFSRWMKICLRICIGLLGSPSKVQKTRRLHPWKLIVLQFWRFNFGNKDTGCAGFFWGLGPGQVSFWLPDGHPLPVFFTFPLFVRTPFPIWSHPNWANYICSFQRMSHSGMYWGLGL
jgi:hypothetical protein